MEEWLFSNPERNIYLLFVGGVLAFIIYESIQMFKEPVEKRSRQEESQLQANKEESVLNREIIIDKKNMISFFKSDKKLLINTYNRIVKPLWLYVYSAFKKITFIHFLLIILVFTSVVNMTSTDIDKRTRSEKVNNWWFRIKPKTKLDYIYDERMCHYPGYSGQTTEFNNFFYKSKKECERSYENPETSNSIFSIKEYVNMKGGSFWDCVDLIMEDAPKQYREYRCNPIGQENGTWFWIFGKRVLKVSD